MLPPADDWARLNRWFDQLIDAPPEVRNAQLAHLQAADPALHEQLLQLLEMAQKPDPRLDPQQLDRRAAWQVLESDAPRAEPELGERIGAWRVERHLGRGGMGEVYEVARADGAYEQRAALKLILGDVNSKDFLERFARERQILAVLNHPGIARLLDGGEDARGRPFLVMEFVAGVSVDRYCEAHQPDIATRLRLFLQVADTVEHAHRQRVIHRDLKPSNILVSTEGQVKLLDFGIARVLAEGSLEPSVTHTSLLLTPQYCAPEQVLGLPMDSRTDIYQLGLLLFELLTGQRAQEPLDATPHALLQAVCVSDRPRPSSLVPAALARSLRGDLDWIVLKALRQEPLRRYASVQALSDDVRRYLDGAPVHARPETLGYRLGKFIRLHPWGVTSTAAAFLLMTAYAVTATFLVREVAAQRDLAAVQGRTKDQVLALITRMFQTANPEQALGRDLTAKQLLDLSWPLIDTETSNQPEVQVELLNTLGETYRQLGDYPQALARLQRARELLEQHPQLPPVLQATSLRNLGRVLIERGENDAAEVALLHARQLLETSSSDQLGLAATLTELGYLQHKRRQSERAEPFYQAALEMYRRLPGDQRRARADVMERLAVAYSDQAKYAQAAALLQTTLELQQQLLPPGHPDIASNMANLAEQWRSLGRLDEAAMQYRKALTLFQQVRGAEHPETATVMNNLARVLRAKGQLSEAEKLLQMALATRRKQLGDSHELVAMSLQDLGDVYRDMNDPAAAERHYRQALDILPAEHAGRAAVSMRFGQLYEARGEWAAAAELYATALAIRRARVGNQHEWVADTLQRLGTVQLAQGLRSDGEAHLREALQILRLHSEPNDARVVAVTRALDQLAAGKLASEL